MLRIVFMGTPDFSVPTLAAIVAAGHDVAAVYSQPPRPAGRGMAETKSPVQRYAETRGVPVETPRSLKLADAHAVFASYAADAAVVVAYGLLLPQAVLDAPRLGCFNLHASLLPRWRGAAPIQRAIMAGDTETAAIVMRMEAGLDTGPMCVVERCAIGPEMTAGALHDVLSREGAAAMVRALGALEQGRLVETPQPLDGVTYAAKLTKAETRLDFSQPADVVHNYIRALSPVPGAWFEIFVGGKPERIKVLQAERVEAHGDAGTVLDNRLTIACGESAIRPTVIQRAGKTSLPAAEALRGRPIEKGTRVE